nr:transmembrane protein 87B-like [Tanacetum cinerariifolium]
MIRKLVFIISLLIVGIKGSIHEYRTELFTPQLNAFLFHGGSEGLFASKHFNQTNHNNNNNDSSLTSSIEGKSFIRFESVTFKRTDESAKIQNEMQSKTGLVEAIVFEVKDTERIGGNFLKSNSNVLCCNPKLAADGSCTVGEVIIKKDDDNPQWPIRIQTFFAGKEAEAKMTPQSIEINKTGMYYLYFMYCDPQLKGTTISGRTVWRNPDGYLSGKMVPLMTFYGVMSLAYLVLGLGWFLSATGSRPFGITVWAVTISAVKKTLSRLLLLVVSMGYGVVRPTLGGVTSKVLILGAVYFVASEALELVENLGNINDFSGKTKLYLVLPVAFLDSWFILWIFSSLSKTLEKLQMRRSIAKLEVYRKFTNALALFVLLSIAWIGYELYFNATDPISELWRIYWIIPAFWSLLAYSLLVVICILWAPSRNPTRYAYGGDTGDDYDEEAISLTSGVKVDGGEVGMVVERKEKKGLGSTDHLIGLTEDLAEDKRE